jgi:hypothetical protein
MFSLAGSLAAGLLVISSIFVIFGVNPLFAIAKIFSGSFGSVYGIQETITKAIPLILIGAGLTLALPPPAGSRYRTADVSGRFHRRRYLGNDPGYPEGKVFHQ